MRKYISKNRNLGSIPMVLKIDETKINDPSYIDILKLDVKNFARYLVAMQGIDNNMQQSMGDQWLLNQEVNLNEFNILLGIPFAFNPLDPNPSLNIYNYNASLSKPCYKFISDEYFPLCDYDPSINNVEKLYACVTSIFDKLNAKPRGFWLQIGIKELPNRYLTNIDKDFIKRIYDASLRDFKELYDAYMLGSTKFLECLESKLFDMMSVLPNGNSPYTLYQADNKTLINTSLKPIEWFKSIVMVLALKKVFGKIGDGFDQNLLRFMYFYRTVFEGGESSKYYENAQQAFQVADETLRLQRFNFASEEEPEEDSTQQVMSSELVDEDLSQNQDQSANESKSNTWLYIGLGVLGIASIGGYYYYNRKKQASLDATQSYQQPNQQRYSKNYQTNYPKSAKGSTIGNSAMKLPPRK